MQAYENARYIFSEINPSKKFASFDYFEISKLEDARFYMEKNMIIKLGEKYFQYKGEKTYISTVRIDSKIVLKSGSKIISEFTYL